ncbi:RNA polymerase sigma factor [Neorhizobium sp. NCHU2750]|uniref:RNA polymerase sigma factor n=1 Tax=Neorhizobium sp. NCHU2750 TaxID=1825976 RepID=UPI000E7542AA|nr:RNA polymerase sigma factor [Neorhizobium sp. NCHU2750]
MSDLAHIELQLTAARPKALGALYRYFRDLDMAEEAFQEACLRAIRTWPDKGPPRDPAAWLILVARNSGVDEIRKRARNAPLPEEAAFSDLSDAEEDIAERLDNGHYRDDILRLMFICCHPDLPNTQQIALALRIISGLSVGQIARAFLVSESAMEQRITRAKARIAKAQACRIEEGDPAIAFEAPDAQERAGRLTTVAAMIYLVFNEGYSAGINNPDGAAFCDEAIRLCRLLMRLFPSEPEVMGLAALMLLQHARSAARFDGNGEIVLLEDQDRGLWDRQLIAEALAMLDKAIRHRKPGPYQVQAAIAALHARAGAAGQTDWGEISLLYELLERLSPSPVVTLNRAVALSKLKGADAALELVAPLGAALDSYFYFHGVRGGLLMQAGRQAEARQAFDRAIALANSPAEAAHIRMQIDRLGGCE